MIIANGKRAHDDSNRARSVGEKKEVIFLIARVTIFTGDHLVCVGVANVLLHHDLVDLVDEPLVLAAPVPFSVACSNSRV